MNSTEFLDIGRHCTEDSCMQLDFLPFSCPSCHLPFCQEHWRPASGHSCASYDPALADNRIPSCPLCSTPISFPPGTDPNGPMDAHLSTACTVLHPHLASSARTKSPNECGAARCHTKMVVPIQCDQCRGKFCPKHRFASDHACAGRASKAVPARGGAAGVGATAKRTFGGLLGSSAKKAATVGTPTPSSSSSAASSVSTRPTPRATPTPPLAGLAALRRAQHAQTSTTPAAAPVGSSANPLVLDSSSDDSDVQVVDRPTRKPHSAPAVKKALAGTGLRGGTSKRALQEQESARKALEVRAKKGLLTEEEKVRYATMQAMAAKKGGKASGEDGCTLC